MPSPKPVCMEGAIERGGVIADMSCHRQGLEQFKKAHGRAPDVISIASNFWDMASM